MTRTKIAKKPRGNPAWKKGVSGNPLGRPKLPPEVTELARAATPDMLKVLIKIARDRKAPPAARVAAAEKVIDRGFGKPAQTINTNVRRTIVDISDAELAAIAFGSGERTAGETEGEDGADSVH